MNNIERFFQNDKWYDERFYGEREFTLSIKENPDLYLHMWDGYLDFILNDIRTFEGQWIGFTRDNQEFVRTFSRETVEIENIDEYITDLLLYKGKRFYDDEMHQVYNLILDFLYFAKENNLTVLAEYE